MLSRLVDAHNDDWNNSFHFFLGDLHFLALFFLGLAPLESFLDFCAEGDLAIRALLVENPTESYFLSTVVISLGHDAL